MSDGSTIEVKNGANGLVQTEKTVWMRRAWAKQDTDGEYYWTLAGTAKRNEDTVTGNDGHDGSNGVVKLHQCFGNTDLNYWMISY